MKASLLAALLVLVLVQAAPAPTSKAVNVRDLQGITFRYEERTVPHRTGDVPRPRLSYQIVHPEASLYSPTLLEATCYLSEDGTWICTSPQMPVNLQFGSVSVNCDGPLRNSIPSDPYVWVDTCSLQYELVSVPLPTAVPAAPAAQQPRSVLLGAAAKSSTLRMAPQDVAVRAFQVVGDGDVPMGLVYEAPRLTTSGKLIVHFVDTNDDIAVTARKIGSGPIEIFSGAGVAVGSVKRQSEDPKAPFILSDGYGIPFAQSSISERLLGLMREYVFSRLDTGRVIARLVPKSNGEWRVAEVDTASIDPRVATVIASMIKFRADMKDEL